MSSLASIKADRIALEALHGLHGRSPAIAAGLKVFNGPVCIVRGHGRARRLSDSHCLDCIEAAMTLRSTAGKAGRADALRMARAEVAREQKAAERARLKEAADALKAKLKADKATAVKAAERAQRAAERKAVQVQPVRCTGPLTGLVGASVEDTDDSPPWE